MGFFKYLFDNEYIQRNDIDSAAGDASAARFLSEGALENVNALAKTVREQRDDIRELGIMVNVLIKMLAESGGLDATTLRYRVEAEMESAIEATKQREDLVTCVECRQRIKTSATSVTEDGIVCDRCLATR